MSEKYVCIGDIHGRNDLLQEILRKADAEYPGHRLLFLGDYIDRGPDSFDVLETVIDRVKKGAAAVLGNHEDFMLRYIGGHIQNKSHPWLIPGNGGQRTIHSYQKAAKDYSHNAIFRVPGKVGHLQFLRSLPHCFETDTIFASHAPIHEDDKFHSDRPWTQGMAPNDREMFLWNYFEDEENAMDHGKLSVCGHIHALRRKILLPRVFPQIIYCDTGSGCASWGPLTAVIVEDGKYLGYFQAIPKTEEDNHVG